MVVTQIRARGTTAGRSPTTRWWWGRALRFTPIRRVHVRGAATGRQRSALATAAIASAGNDDISVLCRSSHESDESSRGAEVPEPIFAPE